MITRKERASLATLLIVAVAGHLLRMVLLSEGAAPGGAMLIQGASAADPMLHRARAEQLARPLATNERVDLNRASAADIARLPRVSLKMAKTIVRERETRGGLLGVRDLDEIRGVGPGLIAAVTPHVTFGDTLRIAAERARRARGAAVAVGRPAPPAPLIVQSRPAAGPESRRSAGRPIRLNSASQADLERLPGIGPARARAIVAYRQGNGPFASVEDLEKVPGISRRLVGQLAGQVTVP